jgi:thiol-disulfide isomerase/thioredoxin
MKAFAKWIFFCIAAVIVFKIHKWFLPFINPVDGSDMRLPPLRGTVWLNSNPISPQALKGKVVLVDFWDYTCVNCLRTFPYLKGWYARYHKDGLVIIGVHTPEFDFAKKVQNVEAAVHRFGLEYPIVLDNDYNIWHAFHNEFWPHEFLFDAFGKLVHEHIGEGDYGRTELYIQESLRKIHPNEKFPKPLAALTPEEMPGAVCYPTTPELYVGYSRGVLGNPEGYSPGKVVDYVDPKHYQDGEVYANGEWRDEPEDLRHARTTKNLEDYIVIRYHALEVNAVIRPIGTKVFKVYVTQDGKPVPVSDKGADLHYDAHGESYIWVDQPRMYQIVYNQKFGSHVLKLASNSPDFALYSYTFGGCTVPSNTKSLDKI